MTTHKNKLRPTQLEYLFTANLGGGNQKKNKLTNTSRLFSLLSELRMCYTPLTWYEQEDLGHKAHLESFPRALCFYVYLRQRSDHKDTLVGLTGW